MDRVRRLISDQAAYEPLEGSAEAEDSDPPSYIGPQPGARFSRLIYGIFFLLGVSMLWAWNTLLAAAPYFHTRFESDEWASTHYQPSILSVFTVTNLASVAVLAKVQKNASYPWRITVALLMTSIVFTLLAFSTVIMKDISVRAYFGFLMVMVFGASLATGINQNGVFAYVLGFDRDEYTQAIMGGQGLAGVLPCIVQILSALVVAPTKKDDQAPVPPGSSSSKSAFIYFIAATVVSVLALLSFLHLIKRQPTGQPKWTHDDDEAATAREHDQSVGLWTLFKKLRLTSSSVFLCFVITMVFPVYTAEIESVNDSGSSRLYSKAVFIPLAFLFWNVGDMIGRMAVLNPRLSLAHRPFWLFVIAIARAGFIPLYLLCNIGNRGAVVQSDFFYLFVVQLLFGASNGFLASSCMMGSSHWVAVNEREAAGGFMSMMLVGGLAAGSLLSFGVASA
ncbi:hypothetical protein N7474_001275 [Penicillium riverlandense]|uniref:uncharacterized protein n=1 Tax=Penicillium riverlandense TaxID=1903569 RepID=UPI002547861E|nr:uncharacterized protein N7474_001275 [Penicillium riverlandense]KAJ5832964.1 hypothetical protein N7474_001275 [Penicillium riverlandense]